METPSDLKNAHLFTERYAATLRYLPTLGWYQWSGQRWQPIDHDMLIHLAERIITDTAPATTEHQHKSYYYASLLPHLKSIINLARCQPALRAPCNQFDTDPFLLNVGNGTVDLRNATLLPHDPHNFLSRLIPGNFEPTATSPLWEAFLDQITNHDLELQDYLQRAVGYSLTASTIENIFFILYGIGRNGKSTFLTALQHAFGDYFSIAPSDLFTSTSLNQKLNTILASLAASRFVTTLETRIDQPLHLSLLKPITTGEAIFAHPQAHSAGASFTPLTPQFKLWLMTNYLPIITDDSTSFWHRLKLIPFTNRFITNADRHLADKLALEAPAILTWAINGARRWYQSGLIEPACVTAATTEYRQEQNLLLLYLNDQCIHGPDKSVSAYDLYNSYIKWNDRYHIPSISMNSFGRKVTAYGIKRTRTSTGNVYQGITISPEPSTPSKSKLSQQLQQDFMQGFE